MTTDQVDARQILATSLVTAIDHVGIAVADLDAAIAWYHDTLGMILVHEEVNEDQGIREAMIAVPGGLAGTAQIQLMAPIDDSSTIAKFLDKRGPGIQQMAVRVSDLDALCERLLEQSVRLVYEAPRRGTANSRINFIHPKDAGGVLIELVEQASQPRTKFTTIFGSGCDSLDWSSTGCANADGRLLLFAGRLRLSPPAIPPDAQCQNVFRDRSQGSGRSWRRALQRPGALRTRDRRAPFLPDSRPAAARAAVAGVAVCGAEPCQQV
jgi:methylmalonyl-CoA/ethylmalonyl-CoA epimerase